MHSTYYKGDQRYTGGESSARNCESSSFAQSRVSCSTCRLPDSSSNVDCHTHFGRYDIADQKETNDYSYSQRYDKLKATEYQTSEHMGAIGEYYPFVSVLLCKRAT